MTNREEKTSDTAIKAGVVAVGEEIKSGDPEGRTDKSSEVFRRLLCDKNAMNVP